MALLSVAATIAKYRDQLDDAEDELAENPELKAALENPEFLKALIRKPGSKLAGAGLRLFTGQALKTAWTSIIPSYGLTLIYINIHFCFRHLAYWKGFTPLGSEWRTWRTVLGWPSFTLKYAELTALVFLDMLVLLIVLGIATLIGMIAYALTHPCEFVGKIGYESAAIIAALGGPAVQVGVVGCTVVNSVSG